MCATPHPRQCHFIGRRQAAGEAVARWCRRHWPEGLPAGLRFVVPTALAHRRLRDALMSAYGAIQGVDFLMPAMLPACFSPPAPTLASPAEQLRVWDRVFDWLRAADPAETLADYLFPGRKAWIDRPAARYAIARRLARLRGTLVEAGLDFAGVAAHPETAALSERERNRWAALDALETKYREELTALSLQDPADWQRAVLAHPVAQPFEGRRDWHLIVACVPDLMPAFASLFAAAPRCDILVQAEPDEADRFNGLGLPLPERWARLEIPLPESALQPAETPVDEAAALDRFLAARKTLSPDALCLALLNEEAIAPFTSILSEHGLRAFEPEPIPLAGRPPARALGALIALARDTRIELLRPFLSLPQLPRLFDCDYATLRTAFVETQARHHPQTLRDLLLFVPPDTPFRRFLEACQRWRTAFLEAPIAGARAFLVELYGRDTIDPTASPLDFAAFEALRSLFRELASLRIHTPADGLIPLLAARLADIPLNPLRQGADVAFEGRLELLWSPAPLLLMSGLNEGFFPDGTFEDAFLPNTFRKALGLRHDATRVARDAYILHTATAWRRPEDLCLTFAQTSLRGDWLKPSRLLFRCAPSLRLSRAARFFREAPPKPASACTESALAFQNNPRDWIPRPEPPVRLSASAIKRFLASPLEYWLSDILGLDEPEPVADGLSAADFGTLLHETLKRLPTLPPDARGDALFAPLRAELHRRFTAAYGPEPDVCLLAGLQAAERRLRAAVRCEETLRDQGWETRFVEDETRGEAWTVPLQVGAHTFLLYGRIDRIDYHPIHGWRILDYKTGNASADPSARHYTRDPSTGSLRWHDFQLPLYRLIARKALSLPPNAPLQLAYFTLPAKGPAAICPYTDPEDSEATTLAALRDTLAQMLRLPDEPLPAAVSDYGNPLLATLVANGTRPAAADLP